MPNIFRLLADFMHAGAVFVLLWKLFRTSNAQGISLKSQLAYEIVFLTRYVDLIWDRTNLYNVIFKIYYIVATAITIYLIVYRCRLTYQPQYDVVKVPYLILPVIILGFVATHRASFTEYLWNYIWTFSIILESVAMLPQLVMLWLSPNGDVEGLTSNYIILMSLYRALYIVNWIYRVRHSSVVFPLVLWISAAIQTILYADFVFEWVKARIKGERLNLDSTNAPKDPLASTKTLFSDLAQKVTPKKHASSETHTDSDQFKTA